MKSDGPGNRAPPPAVVPNASATVLVIDDAADVHALVRAKLRPEGVRVVSALGWEEGLELARGMLPDLILLDVDMPGNSGLDLCRALKEDPATLAIPIIFLTGSADVNTKVHGFDLGAIDYVTKPFHPAELRARVRSALRTKRYHDLLAARAQIDALTGLHNRRYFDAFLDGAAISALRDRAPLSLILIDLDHFKGLNDRYGHPFGDLVLQRTGDVLAQNVRAGDAACRHGGEEMAIILPGVASVVAMDVAERVRRSIATTELVGPHGERVSVTASLGIAELHEVATLGKGASTGSFVAAADGALYEAKHRGRNRVCSARIRPLAA